MRQATRPAIVTGASSGIGRETARLLAAAGCAVLLTSRRKELLEETAAQCPSGAWVLAGDLTSPAFVEELVDAADDMEADGLPILVNAAGVADFGPLNEMAVSTIQEQIEINLLAPVLACREVLPWMRNLGGGDIVNVGSIASVHAFPGAGPYVATKHGLLGFTRSLAADVRKEGIRVTAILPGSTDTPLWVGQSYMPEKADMLSAVAVAEAISDAVLAPRDRSFDEILLMPPKGIL